MARNKSTERNTELSRTTSDLISQTCAFFVASTLDELEIQWDPSSITIALPATAIGGIMFISMLLFFSVTSADTPYSNEFQRNLLQYRLFQQLAPAHDGYRVREYLYYVKGTADTLHDLGAICLEADQDLEDLGDIVANYFRGRETRLKREPAIRLLRESLELAYPCQG